MSVQTSLPELQRAIYGVLSNDTTLGALVTGVFDWGGVPESQAYPYVTIGDATEVPFNTLGKRGYQTTVTLHIWSRALGFAEVYSILARLNTLLDQEPLSLQTQTHIFTMLDNTQTLDDPDGLTHHVAVRYRCLTQE